MRQLTLALVFLAASTVMGQDASAKTIMEQAHAAKPRPENLRFYDLDWASNLAQARQRAQQENRPIVFLWVTNITAGCDFFTGHT